MKIVKHVKMLIPSELLYAFDPDAEDVFLVAREKGRLVARPLSEHACRPECDRYEEGYDDGYEDGRAKGYNEALKDLEENYDDFEDEDDCDDEDDSEEQICDCLCIGCPCYDDLNDRCRHKTCCMEEV